MSRVVELLSSRRVPQIAVLALMSVGFAGCSADMSTRLSQTFDGNQVGHNSSRQFGWQGGEATGSVPQRSVPQAPRELPQYRRPAYSSQPLYQSQPLPPPISTPQSYPSAPRPVASAAPVSGGGNGMYMPPPSRAPIEHTGSTAPRSVAAAPAAHGSGTTVIVGTSDTLEGLSRRYNVSPAAILQANGYRGPRALSPGQSLIIPRQSVPSQPVAVAAVQSKPVAAAATHYVNRGDTLMGISRRNNVPVAELARANGLSPNAHLKPGTKITVPAARAAAVAAAPVATASAPAPLGSPSTIAAAPVAPVATVPAARVAAAEPPQKARLASATATPADVAPETPVKAAEATGALPTFRWPVRGRVAAGYGAKTNGKSNDGINIAVPEGTPVKAAEDGVVAYAGNELKGYGNLVLVRHSNGYVTAYAHASELMVKRGETIKRGQVIMKSGQSGEVSSPQLHFEIRKGSSPVDPLQFLNGA